VLERDLDVGVGLDDPAEPGGVGVLAVDAAGPAHRVDRRDRAGVAADEVAEQLAGAPQPLVFLRRPGRLAQQPMRVQLRLDLAGVRVGPFAAAREHQGGRTQRASPDRQSLARRRIDLDGDGQAFAQIGPAGLVAVEGADRRREHDRAGGARGLLGVVHGVGDERLQPAAVQLDVRDPGRLVAALPRRLVVVEVPEADPASLADVPEDDPDEETYLVPVDRSALI
jgi:hypothetical protein